MVDDSKQSNVRITVPSRSEKSENDPQLHTSPVVRRPDYTIVVPVADALLTSNTGINVRRFLQTAIALAADNDGSVLLLGLASVESEASVEVVREYVRSDQPTDVDSEEAVGIVTDRKTQLEQVLNVAEELNPSVSVNAVVRTVTEPTRGVLKAVDRENETAVLLLRGTDLNRGRLFNRSKVDRVLADAACDVFVEDLGAQGGSNALYVPDVEDHAVASLAESEATKIDSILLPVGMGAHAALATEAARAIARASGASVTILHVISPEASARERAEAKDLLRFAEYILGPEVSVDTELREASDTVDEIVQEAHRHKLTSIGFPEEKARLKQLVFSSVQEELSAQSDATIVMARDSDRTMRSLYYRWKRGMEGMNEDQ